MSDKSDKKARLFYKIGSTTSGVVQQIKLSGKSARSFFKQSSAKIYKDLKTTYWFLFKGNQNEKFCNKYHHFLNKTKKFHINEKGIHKFLL